MRHLLPCGMVAVVALALAAPVAAQDRPKGDIAVSYSVLYDNELSDDVFGVSGWLPTGFVVAGAVPVTSAWSVVGEVGGNYKPIDVGYDVTLDVYSFLGGVRYSGRGNPRFVPFCQLLLGAARASASAEGISVSTTGFAAQFGGGVDVTVSKSLAVRFQGDYRAIRADGGNGHEFRFATGIVYRF